MTANLRPYQASDLDALYDVCVRTAASGDDLSDSLGDPRLPGDLYAGPYGVHEPDLAFVVEDEVGVGGYVVGTDDTAAFEAMLETTWLPPLRDRYREGSGISDEDNRLISSLHHPYIQDSGIVADFPAHLHIDLLPRLQRQGHGRQLIERFCDEVRRRGARGVHLGVGTANHRARIFYARVGFDEVRTSDTSIVLGRRLDSDDRGPVTSG
jgi:GNAT superfamily N-acetyltransferase